MMNPSCLKTHGKSDPKSETDGPKHSTIVQYQSDELEKFIAASKRGKILAQKKI